MAKKPKSTAPHIVNPNASLEQLAARAMRRYGEWAVTTGDGEAMLVFLDYANAIIDELHKHPYWEKGLELPYYTHISDARAIPDNIVVSGLLARLAADQGSRKAPQFYAEYFDRMNTILATKKFGVGAEFQFQAVDVDGGGVS